MIVGLFLYAHASHAIVRGEAVPLLSHASWDVSKMTKSFFRLILTWLVCHFSYAVAQTAAPPVVKIGFAGPLSGPLAALGRGAENGAKLAIDQANSASINIAGKRVEFALISEDDQANPSAAIPAAQRLLASGVVGVVGHFTSSGAMRANPVYEEKGVPVISSSASSPLLLAGNKRVSFRTIGSDFSQVDAAVSYMRHQGIRTIAVVQDKTGYGEGMSSELVRAAKSANIAILGVLAIDSNAKRGLEASAIARLREGKPQAIFMSSLDAAAAVAMKSLRESSIRTVVVALDSACGDELFVEAGGVVGPVICTEVGIPDAFVNPNFVQRYESQYGRMREYSALSYDAAMAIVEAIKLAGSAEPARYSPLLRKVSFAGATGPVSFDAKGERVLAEATIRQFRDGRLMPIGVANAEKFWSLTEAAARHAP